MTTKTYSRGTRERAERLPANLFDNDPQVMRALEVLDRARRRYAAAMSEHRKLDVEGTKQRIEALRAEIRYKTETLPEMAFDGLREGDQAFTKAVEARAEIQRMGWQLQAAIEALQVFERRWDSLHRPVRTAAEEVESAEVELEQLIAHLRLERAQAEA